MTVTYLDKYRVSRSDEEDSLVRKEEAAKAGGSAALQEMNNGLDELGRLSSEFVSLKSRYEEFKADPTELDSAVQSGEGNSPVTEQLAAGETIKPDNSVWVEPELGKEAYDTARTAPTNESTKPESNSWVAKAGEGNPRVSRAITLGVFAAAVAKRAGADTLDSATKKSSILFGRVAERVQKKAEDYKELGATAVIRAAQGLLDNTAPESEEQLVANSDPESGRDAVAAAEVQPAEEVIKVIPLHRKPSAPATTFQDLINTPEQPALQQVDNSAEVIDRQYVVGYNTANPVKRSRRTLVVREFSEWCIIERERGRRRRDGRVRNRRVKLTRALSGVADRLYND